MLNFVILVRFLHLPQIITLSPDYIYDILRLEDFKFYFFMKIGSFVWLVWQPRVSIDF